MRHRSSRARLNQKPDHAKLMLRNLVTSLLLYESIRTTKKRAIVARSVVDKLVTTAKTKEPHLAIRSINAVVTDVNASRKLMQVLAKRYNKRSSGFTRMTAVGSRKGDGAELVDLSLVDAVLSTSQQAATTATKKPTSTRSKAPAKKTASVKKDAPVSSDSSEA